MSKKVLSFLDAHFLKIAIGFLLAFIPLYPKFPLFDIRNTWVYIRFEDILVLLITFIWFIQLLRRKATLKTPLTAPIFIFWVIGGVSLLFSLAFIGPHLANFFPNVAVLHYFRRLEYIIPFFIAFSTVKNIEDVKHYLIIIAITLLGVSIYGFGQRYLGFPAYLTMNEEFSKGIPLYLPSTARIASTFAGHYDLAAYLVMMIAFLGSLIFGVSRKVIKLALFILVFIAFILLLLTASRISFSVYLLAISFMLYLQNKKWLIVPVIIVSIFLMSFVSGASERFSKTFRVERVVYTQKGQPIAVLEDSKKPSAIVPEENLPLGSSFLTAPVLDKTPEATTVATIRRSVITSLKTASVSSEIATISGDFLIKRAIVYDISFTTRFQGEWPQALEAFKRNPLLGSGYSSLSLATDNDYLRALGETGIFGFITLLTIFFTIILILRRSLKRIKSSFESSILIGTGAGLLSLLVNATLIDVFEASKIAFTFWITLGIVVGMTMIRKEKEQSLFKEAIEVVKLPITSFAIFLLLAVLLFQNTLSNYFTGDDFTWLKWAAISTKDDILRFFMQADGFFYRPLAKSYFALLYPFFGLKPFTYHLAVVALHFGSVIAVYFTSYLLTKKRLIAFLSGLFFLLLPVNTESILWTASTSAAFAVFFYLWSFLFYRLWREGKYIWRPASFIISNLLFLLAIFSHELALTLPLVILFCDFILNQTKKPQRRLLRIVPLLPYLAILDAYLWLRAGAGAHGLSGDYSFNTGNIIFNTFGNLWGYFGINLAGGNFIPVYDASRLFLRIHKILPSIFIALIIFFSAISVYKKRKQIIHLFSNQNVKIIIFACGWFIIALLPFLGLGNIAERHSYLASIGFVFLLASIINIIWERVQKRSVTAGFIITLIIISGLTGLYWRGFTKSAQEWRIAGETANKILLAIPTNYASFPPKTSLYFVDLPLRNDRAWVFPVGLDDGLWFIYRDNSLRYEKIKTLDEALDLADKNNPAHVFVFGNGELKEAKRE